MEQTLIKFVTGLSEDASRWQKRLNKNSLNVMISGIVLLSALSEVRTHIDYAMKLKSIHCRVDTRTKVNLVVSAAVGIIFIRG